MSMHADVAGRGVTGVGEPVTVALVRHGETPMTPTGAYSGSGVPGPPLSEAGRVEAARAATILGRLGSDLFDDVPPPTTLITSPMVRTRETAEVIAAHFGLSALVDDRAKECNFGEWEGLKEDEIDARWPGELDAWHTTGTTLPPGGESIAQVGERTHALLLDLLAEHAGSTVVVVAHAVTIRSVIGQCLLAPPGGWWRLRLQSGSVSVIQVYPDGLAKVLVAGLLD
ncbi:histidine phosphatase family protein [Occultella kanbiaonis]|uniref:histidine phosphatase family protein n=1 Tax=Occultella kanbiaonis TaxID=2675754 RepID=UPI001E39FFB5|nr:histidine phosphatase family protein [Occultella kanbiaonis]